MLQGTKKRFLSPRPMRHQVQRSRTQNTSIVPLTQYQTSARSRTIPASSPPTAGRTCFDHCDPCPKAPRPTLIAVTRKMSEANLRFMALLNALRQPQVSYTSNQRTDWWVTASAEPSAWQRRLHRWMAEAGGHWSAQAALPHYAGHDCICCADRPPETDDRTDAPQYQLPRWLRASAPSAPGPTLPATPAARHRRSHGWQRHGRKLTTMPGISAHRSGDW